MVFIPSRLGKLDVGFGSALGELAEGCGHLADIDFASLAAAMRKADYDRYLSALFAPSATQPHLLALYAFNFEVSRTAEAVTQPVAGQIRLQWWRDAVARLYEGEARPHDTLRALGKAIADHRLPRNLIEELIDAHERDLDEIPFARMDELEAYCDATSGNLMRLAARILGAGDALDALARDAGIAYALTGLVRALPYHASARRLMLPADLLRKAGGTPEAFFAGEARVPSAALIREIGERAGDFLSRARQARLARRHLPAFLPATLVPLELRATAHARFDPFRDVLQLPLHKRQLAMLSAILRGRI